MTGSGQRIARQEEAFHDAAIRLLPPFSADQLDEAREEHTPVATTRPPGPVQGEGSSTVVLGQPSTSRVGGLGQEQVDDPGNEEVLLVDQVDVRPASQRRQKPVQRLTRLRAAEKWPGLELVQRPPEPRSQRPDELNRFVNAQVDIDRHAYCALD